MKIIICAECHRACCWQGEFMCDDARTADVVEVDIEELRGKGGRGGAHLEHPSYWDIDENTGCRRVG